MGYTRLHFCQVQSKCIEKQLGPESRESFFQIEKTDNVFSCKNFMQAILMQNQSFNLHVKILEHLEGKRIHFVKQEYDLKPFQSNEFGSSSNF